MKHRGPAASLLAFAASLPPSQLQAQVDHVDLSQFVFSASTLAVNAVTGTILIGGVGGGLQATMWRLDPVTLAVTTTSYPTVGNYGEVLAISDDGSRASLGDFSGNAYWVDTAPTGVPQPIANGSYSSIENIQGETRLSGHAAIGSLQWYSTNTATSQLLQLGPPTGLVPYILGMSANGDILTSYYRFWEWTGSGYGAPQTAPTYYDSRIAGVSPNGVHLFGYTSKTTTVFGPITTKTGWPVIWSSDYARKPSLLRYGPSITIPEDGRGAYLRQATSNLTACGSAWQEVTGTNPFSSPAIGIIWHPSMGTLGVRSLDDFLIERGAVGIPAVENVLDLVDDGTHLHILYLDHGSPAGQHYIRCANFSTPASPFYVYGPGKGDTEGLPPHLYGEVLAGTGAPGDSVSFVAADLEPAASFPFGVLAFSGANANQPPLLVDASQLITTLVIPLTIDATTGRSTGSMQWTIPPATAGLSLFSQYVGFNATFELVLSNGLRLDIQ